MGDSARKRNSRARFFYFKRGHAYIASNSFTRVYTDLENYATVEIHLSIGSTVFSLEIFFGQFEYFALLADLNPPWPYYFTSKQLLDEVFVISGIIKVSVSLIS